MAVEKNAQGTQTTLKESGSGHTPPETVRKNAARGLELRREFGRGGTEIGIARGRDLSGGKAVSIKTIGRMVSYFARHEIDKQGEGWGDRLKPSNGYIAWLLWGGDAGKTWANKVWRAYKRDVGMGEGGDNALAMDKMGLSDKTPDTTNVIHFGPQTRYFGKSPEEIRLQLGQKKYRLFDPRRHVYRVKDTHTRSVPFPALRDVQRKDRRGLCLAVDIEMAEPGDATPEEMRDVPSEYRGWPTAVVNWHEDRGRPGLPWERGTLRLEHHPDLHPVRARGRGSDVGALWKLRSMPQVADTIEPIIGTAKAAPWRLEPNEAVKDGNPVAVRQHEWCLRSWKAWTKSGAEYGWHRWLEDVLRFSLVCGFYAGEISLDKMRDLLNIPDLRAPWTVDEWILQNEKPIGLVQQFFDQANTFGGQNKTQVVIPWEKIIHVPFRPAGPSDLEGYSLIRPAYTPLNMLLDTYKIQGLSIAINGMGTWKVKQDPARPFTGDEKDDLVDHFGNFEAGHVPWVILPPGGDAELVTAQTSVVDLSQAVIVLERAAAMALGSSHKLIALHQHGSFAARSSASDEQQSTFGTYGQLLSTAAQCLFAKGLRARFGMGAPIYAPKVLHSEIKVRDRVKRADIVRGLIKDGVVRPHPSIERAMLEDGDFSTEHLDRETDGRAGDGEDHTESSR